MEQNNPKSNKSSIILGALLLLAVIAVAYFWTRGNSLDNDNKTLTEENASLNVEVSSIKELRDDLVADIEILQDDYDQMVSDFDSLEILFQGEAQKVAVQKNELKKIKKDFAKDAAGMNTEIQQLRTIKKDMNALVTGLRNENVILKETNKALTEKVANIEARNKELEFKVNSLRSLTSDLEKDNKDLMSKATRTRDIRIDLRKRGDKPTGSARRTREINVSFNVSNVPESKTGDHNLYIVIKDAKGNPVKVDNPIKASIKPDNGKASQEIIAQQMITVNLFEEVRRQFELNPKDLKAGYYRVSIFADWGLIGGAEFQLR